MRIIAGVMLLGLLLPIAACGDEEKDDHVRDDPSSASIDATEEPRQVATWSEAQARDQAEWLQAQTEPRLLEGARAQQFVEGIPPALKDEATELTSLDLDDTALLVAGFGECGNTGVAAVDGDTVTYTVRKLDDRQCAWAPTRVQVFAVATGLTLGE